MAKKTLMTGIGIQMTSVSTDSTFPLGKSYCVDIDKECADNTVSNLPVYEGGSTGTTKVSSGYAVKKFLLTPKWLKEAIPEESLYYLKGTEYNTNYTTVVVKSTSAYFPPPDNFETLIGWDQFGNKAEINYITTSTPPLAITTTQEDLLPGYRNQRYNFLFKANQYAYNLQWSLIDPPEGVILEPSGYFSLSEDGDKQVSYLLKVQVYNPDTEEKATKEFTLVTAHPSYVPDSDLTDLRIEGPTYVDIKPHRNFREVWHAAGGMPPYTFMINSPLSSQWPYRNSTTVSITFAQTSASYGVRFDFTTNEIVVTDSPNSQDPSPYVAGTALFFEKIPFSTDTPEATTPGNLSFDTLYYAVPQFSNNNYTGRIKLAATKQEALAGTSTINFGMYGTKTGRLVLPAVNQTSTEGYFNSSVYHMTVNRYVQSVALSIAIPPLPKHWGHGDRWNKTPLEDNPAPSSTGVSFPTGYSVGQQYTANGVTWQLTQTGWIYVSGSFVWETNNLTTINNKTEKFLDYVSENRFLGQNMYALGFGETFLINNSLTQSRNAYPFDPWRFGNIGNPAYNYFDVTVIDGNGTIATTRVAVNDPDRDFNPNCGVPYWHGKINFYKTTSKPFKSVPRTTGTVFIYNQSLQKLEAAPYDSTKATEYPYDQLSRFVYEPDNLNYYTYTMDVYFPASRFVDYADVTTYGLKKETTYWPYEKFILPLNKTPLFEMSIHPITLTYSNYANDYWYWLGYYYGDAAFKFRKR